MEVLADAREFVIGRGGMLLGEDGLDEARLGVHAAGEEFGAEATAVLGECGVRRNGILGLGGRNGLVIREIEKVFREDRIIREDTDWIVVDVETVSGRFDDDRFFGVGDDPVEFAER